MKIDKKVRCLPYLPGQSFAIIEGQDGITIVPGRVCESVETNAALLGSRAAVLRG